MMEEAPNGLSVGITRQSRDVPPGWHRVALLDKLTLSLSLLK